MTNVSRPLIALLVGTVAFFALWFVALRPSSSSNGGSKGLGTYQSAVDKAHQAVANSKAAAAATSAATPGAAAASSPSTTATAAAPSASKPAGTHTVTAGRVSPSTQQRLNVVERGLVAHKTIALLFYNPAASDDRAVKQELGRVSTHRGRVVKLAVPLNELAKYTVVTNQVHVETSPTLVLIDSHAQATTLVGFADQFVIAQRVSDALAAK